MGFCQQDDTPADLSRFLPGGDQAGMVSHELTLRSKYVKMAIRRTRTKGPKTPPAHRLPLTAHRA
jgi:hypothetical protein